MENDIKKNDDELLKVKKNNNKQKAVIIILIFIILLMGLLLFIFFTDKKEEPKKEDNKQEEKKDDKQPENVKEVENVATNSAAKSVRVKFAVNLDGNNPKQHSKQTYNDVIVDVTVDENSKVVNATVNGKDVKKLFELDKNPDTGEILYDSLIGYEIYDIYVIFEVDIVNSNLIIYDTRDESKKEISSLSDKFIHTFGEYKSDATGLTIEAYECSMEQCRGEDATKPATAKVIDGLTYESGYTNATYRMEYTNGKLTEPKMIKQYNK